MGLIDTCAAPPDWRRAGSVVETWSDYSEHQEEPMTITCSQAFQATIIIFITTRIPAEDKGSLGVNFVLLHSPRVGLISSGDSLVESSNPLKPVGPTEPGDKKGTWGWEGFPPSSFSASPPPPG